ncbi:flagellar filament capping protein FliD [Paeniglutamicibacter kerguelensis]|uniref:Flagellar hook-associated protein 2 n=1 Tax=Paeniglutamicibacter kerguelensis TaxID=254788 RepID=A0ABS4XEG5_9MICC|nr:flagellar filament capping protein FliD [Paeniglutamicibacter kerguelensis]MBP2386862.1 flagellar hook-associated protein 2 [Paeniglutamicibacter kerguelensis]
MGLALDGLASGLNTTELIKSLMQVEAIPQNILKNKVKSTQTMVSALQALNTKVADLANLTKKLAKPESLQLFTTSSSSDGVKATAGAGANPGSLDVTVTKLAQSQIHVSEAVTEWPASKFAIKSADGTKTTNIVADSNSLDDVIKAVNASDAGVKAVKVATGDGTFRVQFSSTDTGAKNAFTITKADGSTAEDLKVIRTAEDAALTLWAGTDAEQKVGSATNTFTSLLPGVDVTVSKTSTEPVTISVARDTESTSKTASDLVDSLNDLFKFIALNSAVTSGVGGSTSGMIFTGDSTARDVKKQVMDAVVMPIDGKSPSEIGISITKDGKLEFNAEKFAKVLAEDPARIESVMQTVASRVSTVTANLSDKYDGIITMHIKGQESMVSRLDAQVLDWDRRLATREASLKRTYSALEVQLSKLNSQQNYMASQLNSLSTGAQGK